MYSQTKAPIPQTICIASPSKGLYSETFIDAHIRNLPADVKTIYGRSGTFSDTTGSLRPANRNRQKVLESVQRRFKRMTWNGFQESRVENFLVKNHVDAVLGEYGPTSVDLCEICSQAKIPLVAHFHGFDAYRNDILEQYKNGYDRLFRNADAIVTVSKHMKEQLIQIGSDPQKTYCNPYGVNTALFSAGSPGNMPPIFLSVGRFVEKKAPHLTILAFGNVCTLLPDARLVMVGDGPLLGACQQLVKSLRLTRRIDFLGAQSQRFVAKLMREARCFVQHSVVGSDGDCEGTPVAILEAGATGLPVISTYHTGIPEVVEDGVTGFLVPEGDIEGMTQKMTMVGKDADLAATLGLNARFRVVKKYSLEKSIDRLWQIILAAIEKSDLNGEL